MSVRPHPQDADEPFCPVCMCLTISSFCFLSINNKLQQPEAASGVLEYAMKHFGELVSAFSFLLERQEVETWLQRHSAAPLKKLLSISVDFFLNL